MYKILTANTVMCL